MSNFDDMNIDFEFVVPTTDGTQDVDLDNLEMKELMTDGTKYLWEDAIEQFPESMIFYKKKSIIDQILKRRDLSYLGCNARDKQGRVSRSVPVMQRFPSGRIVYLVSGTKDHYRLYGFGAVLGPIQENNEQIARFIWPNDRYYATNFFSRIGLFPEGIPIPKELSGAIRYKIHGHTYQAYGPFNSTSYFLLEKQSIILRQIIRNYEQ